MIISELILLLQDELETKGDIPIVHEEINPAVFGYEVTDIIVRNNFEIHKWGMPRHAYDDSDFDVERVIALAIQLIWIKIY